MGAIDGTVTGFAGKLHRGFYHHGALRGTGTRLNEKEARQGCFLGQRGGSLGKSVTNSNGYSRRPWRFRGKTSTPWGEFAKNVEKGSGRPLQQ